MKTHMIDSEPQLTILTHTYVDGLLHGKCYLLRRRRNKMLEGVKRKFFCGFDGFIKFSLTLAFVDKNQAKMNINQSELLGMQEDKRRLWFS